LNHSYHNFDEWLSALAARFGDRPALVDGEKPGVVYSYRQLNRLVDQTAVFLNDLGLRRGNRFATLTRNAPEFFLLYLASWKLGTLIMPLPADLPVSGLPEFVTDFEPKLLFYGQEQTTVAQSITSLRVLPLKSLIGAMAKLSPDPTLYREVGLDDPGALHFSSGTTGTPKGIPHTPRNVLSTAEALVKLYGLTPDDTHLGILPCYHTAITGYSFFPALLAGCRFVLLERFHQQRFWRDLARHQASYVNVVPTILTMLLNQSEDISGYDLSRLKFIGSGSAPLHANLQERFEAAFGVRIANQYGLSETSPIFFNPPALADRKLGALGRPLEVTEVELRREDGQPTAIGEVGEIVVRGPNVISAYYQNPTETATAFRAGWFWSGDLAHRDEEGFYFLAGRRKEMINRGGQKIYPAEVDNVLLACQPIVKEAATVGVPDSLYGEEVVAYVVPAQKGDSRALQKIIREHCAKYLPPFKCPREIHFVDRLPQTPSGKILRRELVARYDRQFGVEITNPLLGDEEKLIAFYRRVYRPDHILTDRRFLRWWLHDNPFFSGDRFSCKIAIKEGEIVGHCAYLPLPVWSGGESHRGAWTANFIVAGRWRGQGIGGRLHRAIMSEFDVTLDVGANAIAEPILHHDSWVNFGTLGRAVGILDPRAAAFSRDQTLALKSITRILATAGTAVEIVNRVGEEIDQFWQHWSSGAINGTERSATFLNWRYADHPYFKYHFFLARRRGRIVGLAVARCQQVRENNLPIMRVVEFLAEDKAAPALISQLINFGRQAGAVMIDFFCASRQQLRPFAQAGFLLSPSAEQFTRLFDPIDFSRATFSTISFNGSNHKGRLSAALFNDPENWYVTAGDGDQDRPNHSA